MPTQISAISFAIAVRAAVCAAVSVGGVAMAQVVVPSGSTVLFASGTSYNVQPGGTLTISGESTSDRTGTIQFAGTGVGGGGAIVGEDVGFINMPNVSLVMTADATLNAGNVSATGHRFTNFGSLTGDFDLTKAGTKRSTVSDQRTAGRTIINAGGFLSDPITSGDMRAPSLSPGNLELAGGTYVIGYVAGSQSAAEFTFTRPLGSGTGEVRWTGSGGFGSTWGADAVGGGGGSTGSISISTSGGEVPACRGERSISCPMGRA